MKALNRKTFFKFSQFRNKKIQSGIFIAYSEISYLVTFVT